MPYIQKLTTPFLTPLGLLFLLWISYRTTNHIFSRRQRNENSSQFWVLLHISTMYLDVLITATYIYNVFRYANYCYIYLQCIQICYYCYIFMHLLTINSQSASLTKTNIPGRLKIENKNVFYFISFFFGQGLIVY